MGIHVAIKYNSILATIYHKYEGKSVNWSQMDIKSETCVAIPAFFKLDANKNSFATDAAENRSPP
jgi:hypothetical protein